MDINNLPSNSEKSKEQERKAKAIEGTAKIAKRTFFRRLVDIFIAPDAPDLKEYIIYERLLPALKVNFIDMIHSTVDVIFGVDRRANRSASGSRVSYSSYYKEDRPEKKEQRARKPEEILFDTRDDAEIALDSLIACIDQYDEVSIADFYDIAGVTDPTSGYTSRYYGWRDLHNAYILRRPQGYIINFPPAIDIK